MELIPHSYRPFERTKPSFSLEGWIFLAAFSVRLLVLSRLAASSYFIASGGDMKFYTDWALRIAAGHLTDHKAFYGLPGYPFFLGAIFFIVGFSPLAVGILQAFAEAGTATLILATGKTVNPTPKGTAAGVFAALGWVFYQPAQTFSAVLMPTSWLVLAFWGIVFWAMRASSAREPSLWKPWLGIGLLTGLMATMIATILFVLPLPIYAAARSLRRVPSVLAAVFILIAGVVLGASPCWLHNYFVAGEPVFLSAHSGVNFWVGNNPEANGYPKMPPGLRASQEGMLKDSIRLAEVAAGHPITRAEVSRYWSAKANDYIRNNPEKWRWLMLVKVRNLWNAFQYDDLSLINTFWENGIITPGLRFGLVAALGIPGLVFAGIRYPRSRWVAVAVLLHMAALLPVFITERYRLAAAPGLLLLGSMGLVELWSALVNQPAGWIPWVSAYCGVAVAGALVVSLPQKSESLWALECYNTGVKELDAGDLDRAQPNLERAFAYVPENAEINFALGNLWMARHEPDRALQFYEHTLQIQPGHASALKNQATIAIERKQWAEAGRFLEEALRTEPDDAKAHYLLALAEFRAADLASARVHIARALALKPGQPQMLELQDEISGKPPALPR